ncbi:MAG: 3-isopropylmalate dehydratase [Planctomycetes bacterium]|nr:3-isopropylmalate dehydratase [Planctomycetota bacterium]
MKNTIIEGRCWIISDSQDIAIQNIDTDMIFHNAHLAITDISEMGKHTFGNLDGWQDFCEKAQPGDIILAGANFGAGSSRQQAVDCFAALGIQAIIAESFGAIYYRNAVNSGFPVLIAQNLSNAEINSGDIIRINFETGEMLNVSKNGHLTDAKAFSKIQQEIYQAGTLFNVNLG